MMINELAIEWISNGYIFSWLCHGQVRTDWTSKCEICHLTGMIPVVAYQGVETTKQFISSLVAVVSVAGRDCQDPLVSLVKRMGKPGQFSQPIHGLSVGKSVVVVIHGISPKPDLWKPQYGLFTHSILKILPFKVP